MVLLRAVLASPAQGTGAVEGLQGGEVAGPSIAARVRVAHIIHWGLAQGVGEAQGTGAGEGGDLALVLVHHTATAILTDLLPSAAGVEVLAVLSYVLRGTFAIRLFSPISLACSSVFARVRAAALKSFSRPKQQGKTKKADFTVNLHLVVVKNSRSSFSACRFLSEFLLIFVWQSLG